MNADALLSLAARTLGQLPWKVVYLGGSTTQLHLTDAAAPSPELTDDVDAVVEVTSPIEFQIDLRNRLLALGAKEDTSDDAPTCRWLIGDLKVDLMAPNAEILGFTNRWYPLALDTARRHVLADGTALEVVHAPVFLATKLEAYLDRGGGDCLASKDIEDVIAVLDGRPEIVLEIHQAPPDLSAFLRRQLGDLRGHPHFLYAVEGYLREAPARAAALYERLDRLLAFDVPPP